MVTPTSEKESPLSKNKLISLHFYPSHAPISVLSNRIMKNIKYFIQNKYNVLLSKKHKQVQILHLFNAKIHLLFQNLRKFSKISIL
jgi:hypothetical protein